MTYRGEELITKEQAEILKGFAIIFVLMGHGYTNYIYRGPINIIAWGGSRNLDFSNFVRIWFDRKLFKKRHYTKIFD